VRQKEVVRGEKIAFLLRKMQAMFLTETLHTKKKRLFTAKRRGKRKGHRAGKSKSITSRTIGERVVGEIGVKRKGGRKKKTQTAAQTQRT